MFVRMSTLNEDIEAAARFALAYDRMNWWQKELLMLTVAITLDEAGMPRKVAQEVLEGRVDAMRRAVLVTAVTGGRTPEGEAGGE